MDHRIIAFLIASAAGSLTTAIFVPPLPVEAQLEVSAGPPPPRDEARPAQPSPEHVWLPGYWRWDAHAYAWESGRWERPPHTGWIYYAARWAPSGGHWRFFAGHWSAH